MPKPLTPGEVARHSRDGEGKSEHFHEALSVSLSLDSSPKGRAFLLVNLEFLWVNTDAEMNAERGSLVYRELSAKLTEGLYLQKISSDTTPPSRH